MKDIRATVTPKLHAEIKAVAKRLGVPVATLVVRGVREQIARYEK